jgi:hypothetical protein
MNINDHTAIWDTDTIPMKDSWIALYRQQRTWFMFIWAQMNHKGLEMSILRLLISLMITLSTYINLNVTPKLWTCNIRRIKHQILNELVSNLWILIANQFMCMHKLFLDQWNNNCITARILKDWALESLNKAITLNGFHISCSSLKA